MSAKRASVSTAVAAEVSAEAQVGSRAPRRAASTGKPRRSGSRSRWQKHPSPPPPSPSPAETARRNAAQQALVGAEEGRAGGATTATCARHGEKDTMAAAHGVAGGSWDNAAEAAGAWRAVTATTRKRRAVGAMSQALSTPVPTLSLSYRGVGGGG